MELLQTFANNLLPILLIAGAGFSLGRVLKVEPRPLGRVIFFILSPALVFNLVTASELLILEILRMMVFAAVVILACGGLAWLVGKLLHFDRRGLVALVMTSMFINAGNYGLPLVSFAFGSEALAYAGIFFVTSAITLNTIGVLIASLGRLDFKKALLGLLKVPYLYALAIGLLALYSGWDMPAPLQRTISILADGAIPAMLVLLGIELSRVTWRDQFKSAAISASIRMIASPLLGLLLAPLFGLNGAARQAGIIQASMPTAVMTTIIASEYDVEPSLVTATVFISTIISPLTLTPLLLYLGG